MRRNRRNTKHSIFKSGSWGAIMLVLSAFVMAMVYWQVDSRCTTIAREIGEAEKRLKKLESDYVREAARWDEQKIPDRLSEKLLRFGLEMKYARQDQIVRMNADGRPMPGLAVTRARQRMREDVLAQSAVVTTDARERPMAASATAKRRAARR